MKLIEIFSHYTTQQGSFSILTKHNIKYKDHMVFIFDIMFC